MKKASDKNNAEKNYLDLVPCLTQACYSKTSPEGEITLCVENKGVFNVIAQKVFRKPRVTQIHLDEMGNFIWPLIDEERSIHDIAKLVEAEFGEKADPLYPRIVKYFQILESYNFVALKDRG
jgi:hypothetical protein